jgi:hypothetical protein
MGTGTRNDDDRGLSQCDRDRESTTVKRIATRGWETHCLNSVAAQGVMHALDSLSGSGRLSGTRADAWQEDCVVGTTSSRKINVGRIGRPRCD